MTSPHEAAALRRAEAMAQRADRPRHRRAAEHPQGDPVRLTECRSVEPDGHRWAVVGPARLEVRDSATEGKPIFHGVASVTERGYEVWDVFGPYTEVIAEDAFDEDLARADLDVPLVIGHDQIRRIGRTTAGDVRLYRGRPPSTAATWPSSATARIPSRRLASRRPPQSLPPGRTPPRVSRRATSPPLPPWHWATTCLPSPFPPNERTPLP